VNNPYQAPAPTDNPFELPVLAEAFGIVFAIGVAGAVLGAGTGWLIGTYIPEYYHSVFSNGDEPNFNPVAVGTVTGLLQGAIAGAAFGTVLSALFFWFRLLAHKAILRNTPSED